MRVGDCRTCHGPQLSGGSSPDPAVTFLAPNLTPGGELIVWKEADFIKAMRTGTKPDGKSLSDNMPWKSVGKLSDDELKAIFTYLQSLPKLETTK
jgi:mono/diheme cytochrome c family protein